MPDFPPGYGLKAFAPLHAGPCPARPLTSIGPPSWAAETHCTPHNFSPHVLSSLLCPPQSSSFLGRSAAPTSHRTTSNVGGLNTRSFIFAADTSNSGFPDKSRDGATTNANSTGAAAGAAAGSGGAGAQAEGGQGGAAGAGGLASFAELRKVIASGGDKAGGKKGGGGGLMGLLGLGAGGGQGAGGGGQGGAGGRDSALELKRKLVGGEGMGANKRR